VLLKFNVHADRKNIIEDYLTKYNLYADEPTIIHGSKYAQYSIQVETDRIETPLAKVRYELIKMGARSIDTMPLLSSIPDIGSALEI
jgi:DNA gyrase inhibitor GyrI